jgi:PIN domain nuclease of toxin-antitoxin system
MIRKQSYLLDTHCWLWWHIEPERLSERVTKIIEDGDTTIYFSVVSAWEIVIKYHWGKLRLPSSPYDYIPKRLEASFMDVLPVQLEHALRVEKLPRHHNDPFDRLLIAQALTERLTIISLDRQLQAYDLEIMS